MLSYNKLYNLCRLDILTDLRSARFIKADVRTGWHPQLDVIIYTASSQHWLIAKEQWHDTLKCWSDTVIFKQLLIRMHLMIISWQSAQGTSHLHGL